MTEAAPPLREVVIEATGDLDLDGAPRLCAAIARERRAFAGRQIVVDLSDVEFCDSTGLRALIVETREVAIEGGRLILVVPPASPIRRVIELAGAWEFLNVTPRRRIA
jgi:anti-sigma B factor antagonist